MKNPYSKAAKVFVLFLMLSFCAFGQFDYGFKAGLNFNASGKITDLSQDFEAVDNSADNASGYFFGFYGEMDIMMFYVRPELQYTRFKKSFESLQYKQSKIEVPISIGYKILPFLSAFTGPSFQFILDQDSDVYQLGELNKKSTMGLHFGTRLELSSLGVALRYERGLNANDVSLLNSNGVNTVGLLDTRASQWILELSFSLD